MEGRMPDDHAILDEQLAGAVVKIGSADVVVGIPSFRNAATIGYVAATAAKGLREHFPGARVAIVNADGMLGARACAVVDSDLRSITPQWIGRLLTPITRGDVDYVTPLYARHKHDGTITNSVAYPLTRALYGLRVRQPIGGEFGLGADLASAFL